VEEEKDFLSFREEVVIVNTTQIVASLFKQG